MQRITVIGCVQVDLVVTPVVELPPPGATLFVDHMGLRPGGAGANAALALVEVGAAPRLVGCIGDDHLGRWLTGQLTRTGLAADEVRVEPGGTTGLTVACEAPGRDRTFVTHLGVNATWGLDAIPPDAMDESDHLLLCDYFCAPELQGEAARTMLTRARAGGARTYFDTAWDPEGWPEHTRREVLELLPAVDVFLPNEAEARALVADAPSGIEAARMLQRSFGGWVVVKLGADGCFAVGPDGTELSAAAPAIELVDSTGAGDSFNAGLIRALADGRRWPDALGEATALASSIVSRPSTARYALPADGTTSIG